MNIKFIQDIKTLLYNRCVFVQKHLFFHSLVINAFVFEILYTLVKYALSLLCYLVLYIDIYENISSFIEKGQEWSRNVHKIVSYIWTQKQHRSTKIMHSAIFPIFKNPTKKNKLILYIVIIYYIYTQSHRLNPRKY